MDNILSGKKVAEHLDSWLYFKCSELNYDEVIPQLAIIRIGDNPSDISYEKGIMKKADNLGFSIKRILMDEDVSKEEVVRAIEQLNKDDNTHGILLFRPLPTHLLCYQEEIYNTVCPEKDVDSMTHLSNAGVFEGYDIGYPPCTPEACMELLDYYKIDCDGKNIVILGRSLVVGRPLAMMLMKRNATVTICHTHTRNTKELCRNADIIITSAGVLNSLTSEFVTENSIVIDVSVNWDENKLNSKGQKGCIAGDAKFDEIQPIVKGITPVPGGIGAITTSVLLKHVALSAEKANAY